MPTKRNWAGKQQNYDQNNGEYATGPAGSIPADADRDGMPHENELKVESRTMINENQSTNPDVLANKVEERKFKGFNQPLNVAKLDKRYENLMPEPPKNILNNLNEIKIVSKDGKEHSYADKDVQDYLDGVYEKAQKYGTFDDTLENGGMSEERVKYDEQEIQNEIERQAKSIGTPKYERKATFVLGLPASGKSYITDKLKVDDGAYEIDADLMKQHIPEFKKDVQMVSAVHEESSWMSKKMQDELISKGANMMLGKVGGDGNYNSILKMIDKLEKAGYEINVVGMDLDPRKALARNLKRFQDRLLLNDPKKPARIVSASQTANTQRTYLNTIQKLVNAKKVKNYAIFDADVNMGEEPRLVSKSKGYLEQKKDR